MLYDAPIISHYVFSLHDALPILTSFIVEKDSPGFQVGAIEPKMGLKGSQSAEIILEDCEVPVENVLGEEGQGYINALKILANGRAGLAARNLGSCQKLLDLSMQ